MKQRKIFVITFGDPQAGSTKFRIMQYLPHLKNNHFEVHFVSQQALNLAHLDEIAQADLIINQKALLNKGLAKKIVAANPRLIFDFDDSIYTRPGKPFSWITQLRVNSRLKYWLRHAQCVTTANHYLKNYANRYANRVEVIPMALDLNLWRPHEKESGKTITIGWAGSPGNLPYIEKLEPILSAILDQYPEVSLAIYSGRRPNLSCRYDYVPYREGEEPSFVQKLDIGLLPLTDEEFSRGKSPIKALQYLACGVPVVGNIFGATAEILNPVNSLAVSSQAEWLQALHTLIQEASLRKQLGQAGMKQIQSNHDFKQTAQRFTQLLEGVLT